MNSTEYMYDGSVEQRNNYFPYGGLLNDVTNSMDVQTRKYNGKELDRMHGLDLYDYSARQYDAALGCFTSMDPLCEKYYHISPYAYCAGNPVRYVDPDGREKLIYFNVNVYNPNLQKNNIILTRDAKLCKDNPGIIHLFAHGRPGYIQLPSEEIDIPGTTKVLKYLEHNSTLYNNDRNKRNSSIIVLHSCSTGKGKENIAQGISAEGNAVVIAPRAKAMLQRKGKVVTEKVENNQGWIMYNRGKHVSTLKIDDMQAFLDGKNAQDIINCFTPKEQVEPVITKLWEKIKSFFQ